MKLINTPRSAFGYISPLASLLDQEFGRYLQPGGPVAAYRPELDVREDAHALTVQVDLPGVARENVQVTFHDGVLTIAGERKAEEARKDDTWNYRERSYGRFERRLTVNTAVNTDQVRASHKDGVLTVTLPKTAEAKPRQIEIGNN
jgi:HSP20 family protein